MPSRKGSKAGTRRKSYKRKSTRKKGKLSSRAKLSCQSKLKNKIRINMSEYKKGKFSSRQQALAVSYAQVGKKSPSCKKYFKISRK